MTSHKAAHYEFARLCASQPASEVTLANIRAIVLYQTQGLCPVHKLMDADNGTVLGVKAVCSATAGDVRSRRFFSKNWRASMNQHVETLMAQEDTTLPGKCMLNPLQMSTLEALVASHHSHKTLAIFRLAILESTSPPFDVRAIHFFRWDGTCRSSPEEIKKAMARYSSTKKGMATAWKVVLGVALAASVLAAVNRHKLPVDGASQPPPPSSAMENPADQDEYVRRMVATFKQTGDKLHLLGRLRGNQNRITLDGSVARRAQRAKRMHSTMGALLESTWTDLECWEVKTACLGFYSLEKAREAIRNGIHLMEPAGQQGQELKAAMRRYCNLSEADDAREVDDAKQSLIQKLRDSIKHDEGLLEQLGDLLIGLPR